MQLKKVRNKDKAIISVIIRTIFKPLLNNIYFSSDVLDEEVVQDGVRVIIDKKAQLSLLGNRINFTQL